MVTNTFLTLVEFLERAHAISQLLVEAGLCCFQGMLLQEGTLAVFVPTRQENLFQGNSSHEHDGKEQPQLRQLTTYVPVPVQGWLVEKDESKHVGANLRIATLCSFQIPGRHALHSQLSTLAML